MPKAKPAGYKLATYQSPQGPRAGLVVDEKLYDAAKLAGEDQIVMAVGKQTRFHE